MVAVSGDFGDAATFAGRLSQRPSPSERKKNCECSFTVQRHWHFGIDIVDG